METTENECYRCWINDRPGGPQIHPMIGVPSNIVISGQMIITSPWPSPGIMVRLRGILPISLSLFQDISVPWNIVIYHNWTRLYDSMLAGTFQNWQLFYVVFVWAALGFGPINTCSKRVQWVFHQPCLSVLRQQKHLWIPGGSGGLVHGFQTQCHQSEVGIVYGVGFTLVTYKLTKMVSRKPSNFD